MVPYVWLWCWTLPSTLPSAALVNLPRSGEVADALTEQVGELSSEVMTLLRESIQSLGFADQRQYLVSGMASVWPAAMASCTLWARALSTEAAC
jgi:hypothetical protein